MEIKAFENAVPVWTERECGENQYAEFLCKIEYTGGKTSVRLSACGDYTLFVNGRYAASNQYGDFDHYKIYDEIDITLFLNKGENIICILAWYFGKAGMRFFTENPGLIYEVLSDGRVIASSNADSLVRKSRAYESGFERKITNQLGYSFSYDSTAEDSWLAGEGDGFGKACVMDYSHTYFPRPIEKHRIKEPVYGKIIPTEKGFIADLGREYVGLCTFAFSSASVQKLNISYGEILEDGHVKRIIDNRDFSFDYIASAGKNEYTNYMLRLACRYIEFEWKSPLEVEYVGILPAVYPLEENENPLTDTLDREIYRICVNTLRLCIMEHYVDCPWREQCLYAFDSRNQILAGYYAFKDKNLDYVRANLLLMSKDTKEDHIMSICYPCGIELTIPSFSLYYIVAIREYIEYSGDVAFGELVFDKLTNILKAFKKNLKDGIMYSFEGEHRWNFYDWSDYAEGTDEKIKSSIPDFFLSAIFALALNNYAEICSHIGKKNEFDGLCEIIAKSTSDKFLNKEDGLFYAYSFDEKPTELANSLAVLSNIATGKTRENIVNKLASNELLSCSLSMKTFKYDAMLSCGKEKYAQAVLDEIRATYKPMVGAGTDTVWETAKGGEDFDNAGSLCHGWSSIPVYYYNILL